MCQGMHARVLRTLCSPLDQRQESSVKDERFLDFVCLLSEEENSFVDEFAHDEAEDLAEVQASNHLLERLLSGLVGSLVDRDIVLSAREMLMGRRVECAPAGTRVPGQLGTVWGRQQLACSPFTIDRHLGTDQNNMRQFPLQVSRQNRTDQVILRQVEVLDFWNTADLLHVAAEGVICQRMSWVCTPTSVSHAALQPVPKMMPARVLGST